MISGNIIPAIATTTACITGAVTSQIYLHAQGETDHEKFSDGQVNLAFGTMQFLDPFSIKVNKDGYDADSGCNIKCVPEGWTSHTKIVVDKGSMTLSQFIDYLAAEYNITKA